MGEARLLLAFTASAVPKPKGSLTGWSPKNTTRVKMTESVDPDGVFRAAVGRAAALAAYGLALDIAKYQDFAAYIRSHARDASPVAPLQPVETRMTFRLPVRGKRGGAAWAPVGHGTGDIEKLVRNVHDALQDALVLADDAQVTAMGRVVKRYADEDCYEVPGVDVEIWEDLP